MTTFAQALPGLLASPFARGMAAAAGSTPTKQAGTDQKQNTSTARPQTQPPVTDPAYAAASANYFYQLLGGDTGDILWDKFRETQQKKRDR